jgi:predicted DNA-binding protein (UPF0251 family)
MVGCGEKALFRTIIQPYFLYLVLSNPCLSFTLLYCAYAHLCLWNYAQIYIKVTVNSKIGIPMGWRHRRRRGARGRFPKPISIGRIPTIDKLVPVPERGEEPICIETAEVEALRLVDFEGLSQEEAGVRMGVSRGTVWRLLQRARKKTAQALSEGRTLNILPLVSESKHAT